MVLAHLRVKVPAAALLVLLALGIPRPEPEPAAQVWDVLAVLVRTTDLSVPGIRSPERIRVSMSDEDERILRKELAAFAERLRAGTGGRLTARVHIIEVPGPLTTLTGPGPRWVGPADVPLPENAGPGFRPDTVMAFAKIGGRTGRAAPVSHLGGAVGGDRGPDGACFAGIAYRPGWIDGTGTVALHEFLHGLAWALVEVGGFPDGALPDPDEGRTGPTCCPDAPEGDGPFADHILKRHLTARMCAAADARDGPAVRDGWIRGFAVDGEAPAGAWRTATLSRRSDGAVAPLPRDAAGVEVTADDPVVVRIDDGPEVLVRETGRIEERGRFIRVTRYRPGTEIRFRVRVLLAQEGTIE